MSVKHLVASAIVSALALPACGKSLCEKVFDAEAYVHDAFGPCDEYQDEYNGPWYPEQFICDGVALAFGAACREPKLAEADCLMALPMCEKGQEDAFEAKLQACRDISKDCNDDIVDD